MPPANSLLSAADQEPHTALIHIGWESEKRARRTPVLRRAAPGTAQGAVAVPDRPGEGHRPGPGHRPADPKLTILPGNVP